MRGPIRAGGRVSGALLLISLLALACGGAAQLSTVGNSVSGESPAQPAPAARPAEAPGNEFGSDGGIAARNVAGNDLLIIKTGTLALRVKDLNASVAEARRRIDTFGGYVSGSQQYGEGDQAVATITYRIPADRWDAAIESLRGLADKVLSEETRTEEVTGQVRDLGARIANLQATEKALQGIMEQATKITDVLAVQQQLTDVRGQIEQLSTQKKHLEEQAAFSTLSVTFTLATVAVAQVQEAWEPSTVVDQASASLVGLVQAVATAGIWLVIVWLPALAGLAIVLFVAVAVARRLGLRHPPFGSPPPALGGSPDA